MERQSNKYKRKEFEKYRAYAVKLKIPSFQEIYRLRGREERTKGTGKRMGASSAYLKQIE